jgi:catechol 2,3-dioxygenase-like lactoylglutathione lyase family enzyme
MPRIDSIATIVENMRRTLGFYRLLGFEIPEEADHEGYVQAPPIAGRMGITLRCDNAAEVDAVYSEIVGAGYRGGLEPFDAPWGSRHCRILDPDGNAIDLFAPLP